VIARLHQALARDQRGAAAVEFALCAPVLLIGMMGLFDMGHNMYTASIIQGAVQKVARASALEGAEGRETELDQQVTTIVRQIAPGASLEFTRTSYTTFSDVNQPEDWDDIDGNGSCNDGEPFEDANANGSWDQDMGKVGFGGARDAVLYQVKVTYNRPFPVSRLIGQSPTFTTMAQTVLRNQPYGMQDTMRAPGSCA
jgi:Flp pilus assembly pilin Flp